MSNSWMTRLIAKRREPAPDLAVERPVDDGSVETELDQTQTDARLDPLSDLSDRDGFTQLVADELAQDDGVVSAVLLLELDGFHRVQQAHGPQTADAVRSAAGLRLATIVRDTDTLARWGHDAFAILAPGMTHDGMVSLGNRARAAIGQEPIVIGEGTFQLTLSVGAALSTPELCTPEQILGAADGALYEAKLGGRDCVRVYAEA